MRDIVKISILASLLMAAMPAQATNGYFLPGFGVKSQGAGGVGIALQEDSLAQAANPANLTRIGERWDLGMSLFNPERQARTGPDLAGNTAGGFGFNASSKSDSNLFLMPDMAIAESVNDRWTVGAAMVGAGGMNTTYPRNIMASPNFCPPNPGFATCPANGNPNQKSGVDLIQVLMPLSAAVKLTEEQSVGVSLNLAVQRFKAYGLGQFGFFGISSNPNQMTDKGDDWSSGAGLRLGWLGKFMDGRVSLGATYASRTFMSPFRKYKGLFAEAGDFDLPENYGLGLAIKATDQLTVAFDVVEINYSKVASVGNPGPGIAGGSGVSQATVLALSGLASTAPQKLGNGKGLGFGWTDMTVAKLGLIYKVDDDLTLRAGYNYGKSPIRDDQLVFSSLAPATVEHHYSVGFTQKMDDDWELSGTYMYVPNKSQSGCNQAIVDCVSFGMSQHVLGMSFGFKF